MFAVAAIPIWRHFARKVEKPTDQPFLNRRIEGYVGREFTLDKPIVDGVGTHPHRRHGLARDGPDSPAGSRVQIARAEGARSEAAAT